ncbi:hypothetical protein CONCODRAFT_14548 [Conidiobolus coronatus NRRL 28638]|uniref:Exosome complex protein n=1 Tax=Conidiobolus coronatus (strain ATCC 28846 / CBS 209.66 / NRRL 28638) TaxID=796925 RepID=A0A137PIJ1_CONC2|nr:hypothetical protein CONCODRAFT_14548 [Conidiobolus coronatus NRRL 28638]|eukprot:KXN74790.1 hypothetical protein CONCODRAFT_14548 [Conidiobolus coronatus NRRL 28638]
MTDNTQLKSQLNNVNNLLNEVDLLVQNLKKVDLPQTLPQLDTLDRVKLELTLNYILNSSYHAFFKTQGLDMDKHPITKELQRMTTYVDNIRKLEGKSVMPTQVDKEAAKRLINQALNGNAEE